MRRSCRFLYLDGGTNCSDQEQRTGLTVTLTCPDLVLWPITVEERHSGMESLLAACCQNCRHYCAAISGLAANALVHVAKS